MQTLVGLFDSDQTAQHAIDALVEAGLSRPNIHLDSGSTLRGGEGQQLATEGAGGFFNRLLGLNITKERAHTYAESLRRGDHAVTVQFDDEYIDRVREVFTRFGAIDADHRGDYFRQEGWSAYDEEAPIYNESETGADRERYRVLIARTAVQPEVAAIATVRQTVDRAGNTIDSETDRSTGNNG